MNALKWNWCFDEIKTHERMHRKVLRSKTPEGVRTGTLRPLFSPLRCACAVWPKPPWKPRLDPDRFSFTEGLFQLTEMISLALNRGAARPLSRC